MNLTLNLFNDRTYLFINQRLVINNVAIFQTALTPRGRENEFGLNASKRTQNSPLNSR